MLIGVFSTYIQKINANGYLR